MAIDLNQADKQRSFALIPDGTFCKVKIGIDRGGANIPGMDPIDNGVFKLAREPSDAIMLAMRLEVTHGPYAKTGFFENWVIAGGSLDENGVSKAGKISKARIRAAVEALQNVHPDDESPIAQQKRHLRGLSDLHGAEIPVRVEIQDGTGGYPDSNKVAVIVTPDMPEYLPVMQGQEVDPKPSRRSSGSSRPATPVRAAAWADSAAPAPPPQPQQPALNLGVDPSWQRSPDGQYAYNGTEWVPAAAPPPPPPPPPPPGGNSAAAPAPPPPPTGGAVVPSWASGMPRG